MNISRNVQSLLGHIHYLFTKFVVTVKRPKSEKAKRLKVPTRSQKAEIAKPL